MRYMMMFDEMLGLLSAMFDKDERSPNISSNMMMFDEMLGLLSDDDV